MIPESDRIILYEKDGWYIETYQTLLGTLANGMVRRNFQLNHRHPPSESKWYRSPVNSEAHTVCSMCFKPVPTHVRAMLLALKGWTDVNPSS